MTAEIMITKAELAEHHAAQFRSEGDPRALEAETEAGEWRRVAARAEAGR